MSGQNFYVRPPPPSEHSERVIILARLHYLPKCKPQSEGTVFDSRIAFSNTGTVLQARRSRVRFPMASLGFEVDSPPNRNEYQGYFLGGGGGGEGGRCVRQTILPLSCADCIEIIGASTS
jgi:hypothetical protein